MQLRCYECSLTVTWLPNEPIDLREAEAVGRGQDLLLVEDGTRAGVHGVPRSTWVLPELELNLWHGRNSGCVKDVSEVDRYLRMDRAILSVSAVEGL